MVLAVLLGELAAAVARQPGIDETLVYLLRQFLEAGKQRFEDQRTAHAEELHLAQ